MRIDGLYKLLYKYYIYSVILSNPRLKPSYPFLGYTQELQILRFLMRCFAWKWKKIAEQKKENTQRFLGISWTQHSGASE